MKDKKRLTKRTVSMPVLSALLASMVMLGLSIQLTERVEAQGWIGTVYIRADGSIDPPEAPITTFDRMTYTLTDSITVYSADGIVVQRDNIIIDGGGHRVQGTGGPYPYCRGVYLYGRQNVTVRNTHVSGFNYNILIHSSSSVSIYANTLTDAPENWRAIQIHNSFDSEIFENTVTDNDHAIAITYSSNNSIYRNRLEANRGFGVFISYTANHNIVSSNKIAGSSYGVYIHRNPTHNLIYGNDITACSRGVFITEYSEQNVICGNNIENNGSGITFASGSATNKVYHNNIIDNSVQFWSDGSPNTLDDGYPSGGNYWSDYTGVDLYSGPFQDEPGRDGIGDTPYVINSNNTDGYPLIEPYEPVAGVQTLCVESATGTGEVCFTTSHGFIEDLEAIAPHSLPSVLFPHGMFSFRITGLTEGQTVTVTIEFPSPLPIGTLWWKYDNGRWYGLPNESDNGDHIMVISLTDGGVHDLDDIPGQITDPGGPGNPMTVGWEGSPVSRAGVLAPWIALLAAIIAGVSLLMLRRRREQEGI